MDAEVVDGERRASLIDERRIPEEEPAASTMTRRPSRPARRTRRRGAHPGRRGVDPLRTRSRAERERDEYLDARAAHAGGLRELPQARRQGGGRRGRAREGGLVRELLPVRRQPRAGSRAPPGTGSSTSPTACASSTRSWSRVLERNGVEAFDPAGEALRPDACTRRSRRAPQEGAEPGVVLDVVEKGYRPNGHDPASGRVVVSQLDGRRSRTRTRPSASTRRPPTTRSRRPTASSPASTTRTRTRATTRPRSASRRSRTPTTILSDPEKRKQYDPGGGIFGGGFAGRLRPGRRRPAASAASATSSPTSSAAAAARSAPAAAGARPRPRDRGARLVRAGDGGRPGAGDGAAAAPCPTCHGTGAKPGTSPTVCPRCQGRGVEARGAGPVLDLAAVPPVRRHRHARSRTRARPATARARRARSSATAVNIPAGVRDGSRVRLAGQGRGRAARRPARATST